MNQLYEDALSNEWFLGDFSDTRTQLQNDPNSGSDYYLSFSKKYRRFAELTDILKIQFYQQHDKNEEYYDFLDRSRHILAVAIGGLVLYNENFDFALIEITDFFKEKVEELTDHFTSDEYLNSTREKYLPGQFLEKIPMIAMSPFVWTIKTTIRWRPC